MSHQWSFWCWQNPLGRCHDCRSSCHGPVPEDHDCHKRECCCPCLREAFPPVELSESINCLVGRLVGYVEMKKEPANQTVLDISPAFRNDVLRNKRVLVGCGEGFHQECQQPYSPVASWMEDTDVALNDEGQQYGNLDEASAIAGLVPRYPLQKPFKGA